MTLSTAVAIGKVGIEVATDKRTWATIATVIASIITPFVLIIIVLSEMASGMASHNNAVIQLVFNGGSIPSSMPVEYVNHIKEMRNRFEKLDIQIEQVNNILEVGSLDDIRIKAIFYVLFFDEEKEISNDTYINFVSCFIKYEEITKVRSSSSDKNSYANDYKDIEMLKTIADKHKMAILLVHHLRKLIDDDPINMISGSTGLTGAVDTIYVLKKTKRNSTKAKLYVTGRDIEDKKLTLEFDKLTHIWSLLPETVHMQQMDNNEKLCECLKLYLKEKKMFTGTATELSEILKQHYNFDIMSNIFSKIILQNEMKLIKNGVTCKFKRTAQKRQITLLYTYNIDDNKNY